MTSALGPNFFYIHAVFNLAALVMVYCFYPETSCRTLEEIDFLFASKTPFVWETEKRFRELKEEHGQVVRGQHRKASEAGIISEEKGEVYHAEDKAISE